MVCIWPVKGVSGTYCPGDGERGADWDDLAGFGEVDGVSAGIATAGYGDGRGEAGKRRGERDDGELHFGCCANYFDIAGVFFKKRESRQ